jgi:hypothetical protein
MKIPVYFGDFTSDDDIISKFGISPIMLSNYLVLMAYSFYTGELKEAEPGLQGEVFVLLKDKNTNRLYEVNGNWCSYSGLRGQWKIEQSSIDTLKLRFQEDGQFSRKNSKELRIALFDILLSEHCFKLKK